MDLSFTSFTDILKGNIKITTKIPSPFSSLNRATRENNTMKVAILDILKILDLSITLLHAKIYSRINIKYPMLNLHHLQT